MFDLKSGGLPLALGWITKELTVQVFTPHWFRSSRRMIDGTFLLPLIGNRFR